MDPNGRKRKKEDDDGSSSKRRAWIPTADHPKYKSSDRNKARSRLTLGAASLVQAKPVQVNAANAFRVLQSPVRVPVPVPVAGPVVMLGGSEQAACVWLEYPDERSRRCLVSRNRTLGEFKEHLSMEL